MTGFVSYPVCGMVNIYKKGKFFLTKTWKIKKLTLIFKEKKTFYADNVFVSLIGKQIITKVITRHLPFIRDNQKIIIYVKRINEKKMVLKDYYLVNEFGKTA